QQSLPPMCAARKLATDRCISTEADMALDAFANLSSALAEAAARAGASVLRVEARRRPSSGVAFSNDVIVTAAHTVEHDEIEVGLPDGRTAKAALIGRDPS